MVEDREETSDASRASVDELLRNQDWGRIHAALMAFAQRRGQRGAAAEDLVQDAIRRVLDANWEPWDPKKNPSLLHFLTGIMSRNLSNDRTSARAHREIVMDRMARDGSREARVARRAERVADQAPPADDQLAARRLLARRMERLRADVASDAVVSAILVEVERGVETPREQREATGYSLEEIREGRRRLGRHVARVAREIPAESVREK